MGLRWMVKAMMIVNEHVHGFSRPRPANTSTSKHAETLVRYDSLYYHERHHQSSRDTSIDSLLGRW